MQQILLIVQVLVAATIIGLVLLQQGRGADAGASFGGGASGSLFGSRGPATFLAKMTGLLAAVFFMNSIALAYLASQSTERRSVVERVQVAPDTGTAEGAPEDDLPVATQADDVPTPTPAEAARDEPEPVEAPAQN